MSKAILVIDMPECCKDCMCYVLGASNNFCEVTNFAIFNSTAKPSHCPLKKLPEHMVSFCETDDYMDGYNDCLNEILGQ